MPVSETTIKKSSKDYKSWFAVAGVGIAVVIVLAVGLLIYSLLRSNSANTAEVSAVPATSIAAVDVTNPEQAVTKINSQLLNTFSNIQGSDPNDVVKAFMVSLVGDSKDATHTKFGLSYAAEKTDSSMAVEFKGDIQQVAGGLSEVQGSGTVKSSSAAGDFTVPVDLVLANQRMYIRVNDATEGKLPSDYAFISLLQDKWLKIDLNSYLSLPGLSSTNSSDVLDSSKRADLVQAWTENPPLINAKVAPNRMVDELTLSCMTAEMNPAAFKQSATAQDYPPVEICTNNGNTPVYFGTTQVKDNTKTSVGIILYSFGANISITEPTEGVVDLSGILNSGK